MSKTPEIKIEYDLDKEIEKFLSFLHHPKFPQHRNNILRSFPELDCQLKNSTNEKDTIGNFIIDFREKNKNKINKIIEKNNELIKNKGSLVLNILAELMDYKWPENYPNFIIIPTILPFSPYDNNIFYFSILNEIYDREYYDILFISAHEISHMLLQDILQKKYEKNILKVINYSSWYFFKEIMAPVLMNQEKFDKILNMKKYLGNKFLHNIFVSKNNKKVQITIFFQSLYEKLKYQEKRIFLEILEDMITIIKSIEKNLEEKHKIWNKYGNNIINYKKELEIYNTPIKI